jgi:hypothetical protein
MITQRGSDHPRRESLQGILCRRQIDSALRKRSEGKNLTVVVHHGIEDCGGVATTGVKPTMSRQFNGGQKECWFVGVNKTEMSIEMTYWSLSAIWEIECSKVFR